MFYREGQFGSGTKCSTGRVSLGLGPSVLPEGIIVGFNLQGGMGAALLRQPQKVKEVSCSMFNSTFALAGLED